MAAITTQCGRTTFKLLATAPGTGLNLEHCHHSHLNPKQLSDITGTQEPNPMTLLYFLVLVGRASRDAKMTGNTILLKIEQPFNYACTKDQKEDTNHHLHTISRRIEQGWIQSEGRGGGEVITHHLFDFNSRSVTQTKGYHL